MKIMISGGSQIKYDKMKSELEKEGIKWKQKPERYHQQVPAYILEFDSKYSAKVKKVFRNQKYWLA